MVERITSRRSTLRTMPVSRGEQSPSASGSEDVLRVARPPRPRTGPDRPDRPKPTAKGMCGSPRHKICTASLDNAPLIDGFGRQLFSDAPVAFSIHRFTQRIRLGCSVRLPFFSDHVRLVRHSIGIERCRECHFGRWVRFAISRAPGPRTAAPQIKPARRPLVINLRRP